MKALTIVLLALTVLTATAATNMVRVIPARPVPATTWIAPVSQSIAGVRPDMVQLAIRPDGSMIGSALVTLLNATNGVIGRQSIQLNNAKITAMLTAGGITLAGMGDLFDQLTGVTGDSIVRILVNNNPMTGKSTINCYYSKTPNAPKVVTEDALNAALTKGGKSIVVLRDAFLNALSQ